MGLVHVRFACNCYVTVVWTVALAKLPILLNFHSATLVCSIKAKYKFSDVLV